jgi:hypothetical protein
MASPRGSGRALAVRARPATPRPSWDLYHGRSTRHPCPPPRDARPATPCPAGATQLVRGAQARSPTRSPAIERRVDQRVEPRSICFLSGASQRSFSGLTWGARMAPPLDHRWRPAVTWRARPGSRAVALARPFGVLDAVAALDAPAEVLAAGASRGLPPLRATSTTPMAMIKTILSCAAHDRERSPSY